jgi:cell division protein FtsB
MARARKASAGSNGARRVKQVLVAGAVVAALVFAVQGGEFGTRDLLRQRQRRKVLVSAIDSLQRIVDSLKRYKQRVETDPALQERIAREEFGLVRGNKEVLYRIAEPAPASKAP